MIEQHAIVLTLEFAALETEGPTHQSATNQSIATLEIVRQTACGLCGQTRGCGNSLWGKLFGHKSANFKAQNQINAKVGDHVIVGIDESALMKRTWQAALGKLRIASYCVSPEKKKTSKTSKR